MITCIGEILIDQFIDEKGNISNNIGGAPFNVAVSIARSGVNSSFVGAVGNDELGDFLIRNTKSLGLNNLEIKQLKEYQTTIAKVTLDNGERSFKFIRHLGADYHLSFPLPKFVYQSNIVHIGSLMLSENEGRDFIKKLIKELKKRKILISFDVNYREDIFKGEKDITGIFKEVIKDVDILKISEEEIDIFSKEYINSLTDKLVCISLGGKGSMYQYKDMKNIIPSIKVKPVDTTGAGDAFFGAVLSQIEQYHLNELNKEILDKAFKYANIVGALTTLGKGAIDPIPTKEEALNNISKETL